MQTRSKKRLRTTQHAAEDSNADRSNRKRPPPRQNRRKQVPHHCNNPRPQAWGHFDHKFYPHLIKAIADSDPDARRKLRATCKHLRDTLVSPFFHLCVTVSDFHQGQAQDDIVFGVSEARGTRKSLRQCPLRSWRESPSADMHMFAETKVVDMDLPFVDLNIDDEGLEQDTVDGEVRASATEDLRALVCPRIVRHSGSQFCRPDTEAVHVVVVDFGDRDLRRHIHMAPAGASQAKFVVALRSGVPTAAYETRVRFPTHDLRLPRHVVIHFTHVAPPDELPAGFSLDRHVRSVVSHIASSFIIRARIEFVGFETAPAGAIKCTKGLGAGATLAALFRKSQYRVAQPCTFEALTNEEYAAKYQISAEDMALEKGDSFLRDD